MHYIGTKKDIFEEQYTERHVLKEGYIKRTIEAMNDVSKEEYSDFKKTINK